MRILLDTHTFLWWDNEPEQLSAQAFALCNDVQNQMVLSVVSVWEMEIKFQLGKLHFATPLAEMIVEQQRTNRLEILPVTLAHVLTLESLPLLHKDPFDRLLIAQAKAEGISLVSQDAYFVGYTIVVEW